jgi:hypothetical protein
MDCTSPPTSLVAPRVLCSGGVYFEEVPSPSHIFPPSRHLRSGSPLRTSSMVIRALRRDPGREGADLPGRSASFVAPPPGPGHLSRHVFFRASRGPGRHRDPNRVPHPRRSPQRRKINPDERLHRGASELGFGGDGSLRVGQSKVEGGGVPSLSSGGPGCGSASRAAGRSAATGAPSLPPRRDPQGPRLILRSRDSQRSGL